MKVRMFEIRLFPFPSIRYASHGMTPQEYAESVQLAACSRTALADVLKPLAEKLGDSLAKKGGPSFGFDRDRGGSPDAPAPEGEAHE